MADASVFDGFEDVSQAIGYLSAKFGDGFAGEIVSLFEKRAVTALEGTKGSIIPNGKQTCSEP